MPAEMKATAFLIFCVGVVITLDSVVLTLGRNEGGRNGKAKGGKEIVSPPPSSFPLLALPSFSSFSLPTLNFPYLQVFSQPSRMSSSERVRTTKTEYVEVTRRQTVHPVCYTAYEAKTPCLPYSQSDFHDDDYYEYDNLELGGVHQTRRRFIRPTPALPVTPTQEQNGQETHRTGRYLEVKLRKNSPGESSSKIEGSEFFSILNRISPQHQTTEYQTKTVLVTKLEKYTDRRVTATLLAVNCLPVDRSIPMCQMYPSPIKESPDRRSDDDINFQTVIHNPASTDSMNLEPGTTVNKKGLNHDKSESESTENLETTEIIDEKTRD